MKILLAALMMFAVTAQADTAWYMDEERSGEGIIVSELDDGRLVFAFYSHSSVDGSISPVISPAPPHYKVCDVDTVWLTGLSELYENGHAEGNIYYDVPFGSFPLAENGLVSRSITVGTFTIDAMGSGFVLVMERNYLICRLSVFGEPHYMTEKVAE
jgi:hypothetical protein